MSNFVNKVKEFNSIAGTKEEFNIRKCALYTGLILEEVAELLNSYKGIPESLELAKTVDMMATRFKSGDFDSKVNSIDREEALDAAVDIAVVSIGQGISVGADIVGACNEVADNNLSKFPIVDGVRTVLKDANGKVRKPDSYKPPELKQFLKD